MGIKPQMVVQLIHLEALLLLQMDTEFQAKMLMLILREPQDPEL